MAQAVIGIAVQALKEITSLTTGKTHGVAFSSQYSPGLRFIFSLLPSLLKAAIVSNTPSGTPLGICSNIDMFNNILGSQENGN
ncbi:hypothetical protein RRF57_011018 [Xylaria bambusicola]|uniref:Uncharacterized protein n=1 Tax=Xylaria bambusicola TaxID=326684 RepID=A0AAN7UYW9_9PEZI